MNTTVRIEKSVEALEGGKLKKALFLTRSEKTQHQHDVVVATAKKCLENKKECKDYMKVAALQLKETITPPLDDESLEGVEEMLKEPTIKADGDEDWGETRAEKTDEELYAECEECHVATAVVQFAEITKACTGSDSNIEEILEDPATPPEKWIQAMKGIAEQADCGKEAYDESLSDLMIYLKERKSDILEKMEGDNGQAAIIPA